MTYYEILEVSENASLEVIHMAYKALARKYHPDVSSSDPSFSEFRMQKINEAYRVLSDPEQRKAYDTSLNIKHRDSYMKQDSQTIYETPSKHYHTEFDSPKRVNPITDFFRGLAIGLIALVFVFTLFHIIFTGNTATPSDRDTSDPLYSAPPVSGQYSVGLRCITFTAEASANQVLYEWYSAGATETEIIRLMDLHGFEQGGGILRFINPGDFVVPVDRWCFSSDRKVGDAAVISNEYGYTLCYISSFCPTSSSSQSTLPPEPSPLPEPETAFIFENYSYQEGIAPLTINTVGSAGYYFVIDLISMPDDILIDHETKEYYEAYSRIVFYVRGGDSVEIAVPLGTYEIYYATGDSWYGPEYLFGENTVYSKCDTVFHFAYDQDRVCGWTINLQPVVNGNMSTETIDRTEFPKW